MGAYNQQPSIRWYEWGDKVSSIMLEISKLLLLSVIASVSFLNLAT